MTRSECKYHKETKKVLELGVGIGTVLRHFPKKFDIYGLDLMKDYIAMCKQNLPRGRYFVSSMHNFRIKEDFDVMTIAKRGEMVNFLGMRSLRLTHITIRS